MINSYVFFLLSFDVSLEPATRKAFAALDLTGSYPAMLLTCAYDAYRHLYVQRMHMLPDIRIWILRFRLHLFGLSSAYLSISSLIRLRVWI